MLEFGVACVATFWSLWVVYHLLLPTYVEGKLLDGRKHIARLMRSSGISGKAPLPWRKTMIPDPAAAARADRIARRAMARVGQACESIVEYITWYNGTRLHSTLGYKTLAAFEVQDKSRKVA